MVLNVNKKGFMFIETIIMCAILMVGLLVIYNGYTSALTREKERLNYNTIAGKNRLIAIKEYLKNQDENWECVESSGKINCPEISNLLGTSDYIELTENEIVANIKDIYEIKKLYLAKCTANFELEGDFEDYLNTMNKCNSEEKYRFIAEFYNEDTKIYSYAWLEYPYMEGETTNE